MKKLLLIINPVTAKLAITPYLVDIIDVFEKGGYDVTVHISQYKGETGVFVTEFGENYDTVVCAGGDGTLNETVAGVLKLQKKPEIGYIPSGTTNDFATSWGIPRKPLEAAKNIVENKPIPTDISTFCGKAFVYVTAFGAFTEASYSTPQELKKTLGWAAYILEGIKTIPTIRPWKMEIEHDNGTEKGEFLYGMISNTKRVGGFDLRMKEDISLSDGLMELILVRKPENPADNAKMIGAVLSQDTSSEFLTFVHTKHVKFKSEENLPWTVDGECGGELTEGEAGIIEGAVMLYH